LYLQVVYCTVEDHVGVMLTPRPPCCAYWCTCRWCTAPWRTETSC
jgi:hypothetical protein